MNPQKKNRTALQFGFFLSTVYLCFFGQRVYNIEISFLYRTNLSWGFIKLSAPAPRRRERFVLKIMETETRIYKRIGKKQKIRIAKILKEKVGLFAWMKLYFNLK